MMYVVTTHGCSDGWGRPLFVAKDTNEAENFMVGYFKKLYPSRYKNIDVQIKYHRVGDYYKCAVYGSSEDGKHRAGLDLEVFEVSSEKFNETSGWSKL